LAVLKVMDGPGKLIGQELKIYTESVRLGRDPTQSDFSFYADANSSISGLHAKIERINSDWRIVALSQSGNETFLDGEALPMMEPRPIRDGQVIRLGYLGQQSVDLEFMLNASEVQNADRKTRFELKNDAKADPNPRTDELRHLYILMSR